MNFRDWDLGVLKGFSVLLGFALFSSWVGASDQKGAEVALPTVFTKKALLEEVSDQLVYPARIVSKVNSTILAENEGVVKRVFAPLGARVKRGQALFSIQNLDPIYQYAPVRVMAPVTGVVASVEITEGSQVSRGQKLALITDPSSIKIQAEIPAADLDGLKAGLEGTMSLMGLSQASDKPLKVKVKGVSPLVDPATGTATAEIETVDAPTQLSVKTGTFAQVSFKANLRKVFLLPESAVIYKANETFVRVVDEQNRVKLMKVEVGAKIRGNIEILKGISEGLSIVNRSSRYIGDGETVKVNTEQAS